jgi:hypothetical protein
MLAPHDLGVGGFQRLDAAMDAVVETVAIEQIVAPLMPVWKFTPGRSMPAIGACSLVSSFKRRSASNAESSPQPPSRPLFSHPLQARLGGEGHGLKHFSGQQDFQNTQCAADKANDVSSDLLHRFRSYCIPERWTPGGTSYGTKVQF